MDEFTWVESTERRMNFKELHHLLDGWIEGEEEGRASTGSSETWSLREWGAEESGASWKAREERVRKGILCCRGAADGAKWCPEDVAPRATGDWVKSMSDQWWAVWVLSPTFLQYVMKSIVSQVAI